MEKIKTRQSKCGGRYNNWKRLGLGTTHRMCAHGIDFGPILKPLDTGGRLGSLTLARERILTAGYERVVGHLDAGVQGPHCRATTVNNQHHKPRIEKEAQRSKKMSETFIT